MSEFLSVNQFRNLADSALFKSRDIELTGTGQARLGGLVFSAGRKVNDSTLAAFRNALEHEYGVFGASAFDTILGERAQMHKSLRASDVTRTLSALKIVKCNYFISEINRQLDTDPKILELSNDVRDMIHQQLHADPFGGLNPAKCRRLDQLVAQVAQRISTVAEAAQDEAERLRNQGKKINTDTKDLAEKTKGDKMTGSRDPVGLDNLNLQIDKKESSVADKVKTSIVGVGMRINRSTTHPMLFEKIKTNGVEPGFIYKNDWSTDDTRGLLSDFNSQESIDKLNALKHNCPDLAAKCEGKSIREQIMLCGRAHPAVMSAVADYMLEQGMEDPKSAIYKAFTQKFLVEPEQWRECDLKKVKKELFTQIRDAVLNVKLPPVLVKGMSDPQSAIYRAFVTRFPHLKPEKWAEVDIAEVKRQLFDELGDEALRPTKGDEAYAKSPVFKHFTDRYILKLDFNESDRRFKSKSLSADKIMRPERIIVGRKFGTIYRLTTSAKPDKISSGAVTEALANDLARLAGVPSQELRIVRGKYSDGHPKLMLTARFAQGYQDMENGFIKDGQVVSPYPGATEKLGSYKAFFLVTADRDGIGKRGQNKGFAHGKFFAIDPGHSLEGNGRYLELDDNFSFKDTYGFSTKPRFNNFSVFDDDTRFAKFKGALELRELINSGKVRELFERYRNSFNPDELGISAAEKTLRQQIIADIDVKEKEFYDSLAKVFNVAQSQFNLYDDLEDQPQAVKEGAIETIENLEKLTSETTWVSPKGEVALDHLKVIPEGRQPWRAFVDGNNLVYHTDAPLKPEAQARLRAMAAIPGVNLEIDAEGCAKLTFAKSEAARVFNVFSEANVAKLTHPVEAAARATGMDPLAAHREAIAMKTAPAPAAPVQAFNLPDAVLVRVGSHNYTFTKMHYEQMFNNTPIEQRPKDEAQLKAMLASRIRRGQEIFVAIRSGHGSRYEANVRNIACLTLAMHAGTVEKGELNERGAFSVSDPDGQLYRWLDGCKEIYMRTSTHARAYHHQTVDGHLNMPRGIDVPEGMGGLMGGMRTLHYFTLPATDVQPRRLYLKCETYGIYRNTISKSEAEDSRSQGMQTRQSRSGDTLESLKHATSLATVFTRMGNSQGNRKENTPAVIKDKVTQVQGRLRSMGLNREANQLGQGVLNDNGGIRILLQNAVDVATEHTNNRRVTDLMWELFEVAEGYADDNNAQRSGPGDNRLGNEIMLEDSDMVGDLVPHD